MVARLTGAALGFLAFFVAIVAGIAVGNPVDATLSKAILALFIFAFVGLLLGGAAQLVILEHARKREADILERLDQEEHAGRPGQRSDGGAEQPVESSTAP